MFDSTSYRCSFGFALLMHLTLLAFLFIKFNSNHHFVVRNHKINPIHAMVVNRSEVEKQINAIKAEKRSLMNMPAGRMKPESTPNRTPSLI